MGWLKTGTPQQLTETVLTEAAAQNIDEANGVIRNVRILGRQSQNDGGTREYSEQAMRDGARLYEGIDVNIDHPKAGNEATPRGVLEGWGDLRNVKFNGDSVVGDLHYIPEHVATPVLLSRIRRGFSIGLSHNALGKTVNRHGRVIVESLSKARSVDMVLKPATNRNLFESEQEETTLAEFIESIKADHADDLDLLETLAASPVAGPAPMAAPVDPKNNVKAALVAALHALAETADEATLKKTIGALMSAAKPAEVTVPKEAIQEAVTEALKPLVEQRDAEQKVIADLQRQLLIRNVMESHGITAVGIGPERMKTLTEAVDEAAMKTLIESWPPAVRHAGGTPGFRAAEQLTEQVDMPRSSAGVRQLLRSR